MNLSSYLPTLYYSIDYDCDNIWSGTDFDHTAHCHVKSFTGIKITGACGVWKNNLRVKSQEWIRQR